MSRFNRGHSEPVKPAPVEKKPKKKTYWGKIIEPVTDREAEVGRYHIAKKMIECFQYRRWMSAPDVVGPNGERIRPQ